MGCIVFDSVGYLLVIDVVLCCVCFNLVISVQFVLFGVLWYCCVWLCFYCLVVVLRLLLFVVLVW